MSVRASRPLQAPGRRHVATAPDARKNRRTARKSRQEPRPRALYHSGMIGRIGGWRPAVALARVCTSLSAACMTLKEASLANASVCFRPPRRQRGLADARVNIQGDADGD